MHTVTLTKPVQDSRWSLEPGVYIMEDLSAWELAIASDRGTAWVSPYYPIQSNSNSNVLLISNCGYGDALMLTPALRRYRELHPFHRLTLATRKRIHCIFDGLDYAAVLIDYPVPLSEATQYDQILTTEHLQEDESERAKTVPAIDIKADLLGVGPLTGGQRRIQYKILEGDFKALQDHPRTTQVRIGIQAMSSSPIRNYHHANMGRVLTLLYAKGYEILLLGSKGTYKENPVPEAKRDLIKDCTQQGYSFRESAALAATCSCLLTPDSALMHIASALNIPCVALFASTNWEQRIEKGSSVFAMQGGGPPCAPCFVHPKGSNFWPNGMPCEAAGMCVPLNMLQPEQVVVQIEKKLNK